MADFKIGDMRWSVLIARREQQPDPESSGSIDVLVNKRTVKAAVRPVGSMVYMNGVQTDYGITHKIIIRWRDDLSIEDIIIRCPDLPNGDSRRETFKVLRWIDKDGRHRWIEIDAVLEREERP